MNKKIVVRAALGVSIIISSTLFWLLLFGALNDGPDWLVQSLWALAMFLFLGSALGLAYLIESDQRFLYGAPVLVIVPALFFLPESLATGLAAAVAFSFLALAAWRAEFEKSLRIEFVSGAILRRSLGATITALALMVTLFFYFAPFTRSLGQEVKVPRPLFDAISGPIVEVFLRLSLQPGTDIDLSTPEFKQQQDIFFDGLYQSVNDQLSLAGRALKKWIPLGISVSLFFTLKVVGTFLSWLMMALVWLVFRILLWSGIVKIEKVATEKEIIRI